MRSARCDLTGAGHAPERLPAACPFGESLVCVSLLGAWGGRGEYGDSGEIALCRHAGNMSFQMEDLRVGLARSVLRAYPFLRGRSRLSSFLLTGVPAGSPTGPPGFVVRSLPERAVVRCRHGIVVRVLRDEMYVWPYLYGDYEPWNTRVFRRVVRPGDIVFDVGANFGWFTALFAKWVGPTGEVHAFEPVAHLARLTEDAIALNHVDGVVRLNIAALGADEGSLTVFTFDGLPHGHASASNLGRRDAVGHPCRLTTIDHYVERASLPRVDFVKVDVEGHELEVFLGGAQTLGRPDAPIVSFEVNPACLRPRGIGAGDLQSFLEGVGYTAFWSLDRHGPRRIQRVQEDATLDHLAAKPLSVARVERALSLR